VHFLGPSNSVSLCIYINDVYSIFKQTKFCYEVFSNVGWPRCMQDRSRMLTRDAYSSNIPKRGEVVWEKSA
jgi:hypothetical protein